MRPFGFQHLNIVSNLLLFFIFFICKPVSAQVNEDYFEVINTYYESSSGGAYGSGSSEYYVFTLKFKKDAKIYFDTIWFNNDPKLAYFYNKGGVIPQNFHKGDSILLSSEIRYPGEMEPDYGLKKPAKIPSPCKTCKLSPVIIFRVNGKCYFYAVNNITGLEPINYP
jgi:hypothetical protein